MGADSCGLPSPHSRAPPAQGHLDGPDAVPARPVGVAVPLLAGARSPARAPSATGSPSPGGFTDPPELPREGRCPHTPPPPRRDCPLAHLARTAATLAGLSERPRGEEEERRLLGPNTKPRRKLKATNSPFSSLHVLWSATRHWQHPSKIPSGGFHPDSTLSLNYK